MDTKINKRKLKKIVSQSKSYREVARKINTHHRRAKLLIEKYNLECSHFTHRNAYAHMIGKKYGMLTVLSLQKSTKLKHRTTAICKCECGNTKEIRADALKGGYYISCGCHAKNRPNMSGANNPAFKGCGNLCNTFFKQIKRNADRRNLKFNLSIKYLWDLFLKQNKKCALTNEPLKFGRIRRHHETNASLDRIDNSKGYIKGNVRWVIKDVNIMRGYYDTEYFIKICKMVAKNSS